MLGETEARHLTEEVLKRSPDPIEVLLLVEDSALTRFANNAIHQNVVERNLTLIARIFQGKRQGLASTNRLDANGLDEVVHRARSNAEAIPEDPNFPGLASPASYARVEAFDDETAACTPERRARLAGEVCRVAQEKRLNASGAFTTGEGEVVVANSEGVFAYFASTSADFQTVVMGETASGHAHTSGWRLADIPVEALGREAVQKAERGANPGKIEPGEYPVILDPYATQDLVGMLNVHGMGGQSVLDGRSWMNDRIGKKAMGSQVSIWDDGFDLQGAPMPFDYEGVPKKRVDIVREGVVNGPVYDRYTAHKAGKASTGHALPPTWRGMGPIPTNLFMAPGGSSLNEMIRSTEKGLYITRFWYTRLVHPRDCVITGMTRDGVFTIEHGELAAPVKNLRFTQSYVEALDRVEAVGQETRLLISGYGEISTRVPAVKIGAFNFTGVTV